MIVIVRTYVAILVRCNLKDVVKNVVMLLCECKGATCVGTGGNEHRKNCKERRE
jgi:hypothetical protein